MQKKWAKKMWKNKKVLITGINGFVASHLAEVLRKEGAEIYGIVSPGSKSNYRLLSCNLKKKDQTLKEIKKLKPHLIFHLAGKSTQLDSIENPQESFESNVLTTLNLLESIRSNCKTHFIYASSREVYKNSNDLPFNEEQKLEPNSFYELAKITSENLVKMYGNIHGISNSIVRASNIYGPGDKNLGRIVPSIIKKIIFEKSIDLYGDGLPVRDYLFISDLVEGYKLIGEMLMKGNHQGEIFNLSGNSNCTVKDLADKLNEISGKNLPINFSSSNADYQNKRFSSYQKAKSLLGWEPKVKLSSGLSLTYNWYMENKEIFN